jgi:hypothetical protein
MGPPKALETEQGEEVFISEIPAGPLGAVQVRKNEIVFVESPAKFSHEGF